MMKRTFTLLASTVLLLMGSLAATATSVGAGVGLDPTGLVLVSALTEVGVTDFLDLRVEAGFATQEIAGLMLATGTLLLHQTIAEFDPFAGVGVGAALTPPPFSTGFVVEGVAGVRVLPTDAFELSLHVRYLLRYTGGIWTTGPVYEAALLIRF